MIKKIVMVMGVLALVVAIGAVTAGGALAQTVTPPAATTPTVPNGYRFGHGFGFGCDGSTATFDATAAALNLTPTQLFEQLHSGKTLQEVATAQGVDIQKVQDAIDAARTQAIKDQIAQAVKDGAMTQAQADWLLQGLAQGYMPRGGFGGRGHRGGMHGFGGGLFAPSTTTPLAPATGTSS